MTETAGWEHVDVDADVGVRAWGPTRAAAFEQAALGMFALVVAPDDVTPAETREVRAQGDSPEDLLVNWLNECLYVHEIEGFAIRTVEVSRLEPPMIHGFLRGEGLDRARHRPSTAVTAVTLLRVGVTQLDDRHEVTVVVGV